MDRFPRFFSSLLLLLVAGALGVACDSGVPPDAVSEGPPTVQFAASSFTVTESDSLATIAVSLENADGTPVTVEVIYAEGASTTTLADLNLNPAEVEAVGEAFVIEELTFSGSASDGATKEITFDVTDDELEDREVARFALQNLQGEGAVQLGDRRETELSIGFPTIAEIKQNDLGADVAVQGLVTRVDGSDTPFIQDESGGIAIFDDAVGSEVQVGDFIIVEGTLDVFAGLLEIVDVGTDGLSIIRREQDLPEPQTATLAELGDNGETFEATLVRVENLSFNNPSGNFRGGTNYAISDGSGGSLELRVTSGSYYVGQPIPDEPVTFTGVLSQFNGDFGSITPNTGYQLLALQEGDLSGVGDGGDDPAPPTVTIDEARQSQGEPVTMEGTVTRAFGDYARIQDESGPTGASALVIRQADGSNAEAFRSDIEGGTIQPGTVLKVTGVTSEFNGLVQINGGDLSSYEVVSQGSAPSPQSVTLADLESSGEDYESELVEITDLTFSDASGTFENSTNYDVSDGSTTLTLRVQSEEESALGGESIPEGTFTYTGVTGEFNGSYQLTPVRPSDLQ